MRNIFILSLITSISILLMTCGENAIEPPPTPRSGIGQPTDGPVTDEQRLAVLKECADFVNSLGDFKSDAVQQVIVAWLKTRPEIEEADSSDGNVWAYFRDGRVAMIVPNWMGGGDNTGGRIDQPNDGGRKAMSPTGERTSGQPGSNEVKMFHGLGKAFRDFRPFLKDIFADSETEYNVTLEEASIENLASMTNGLGVFFINTHGGTGFKKPRKDSLRLFGLWTTDTTSLQSEIDYEGDLNSAYLVYMLAVDDDTTVNEWHYAITDQFVRNHEHMNFAENAVLFINACNGMSPHAATFRESMVKKAKGEKATYIGWTRPTDNGAAEVATGFILNRMLGINKDVNAKEGTIAAEDPKQRPFDFSAIFDDLGNFTVGSYPLGVSRYGGRLAYYSIHQSEIILTPSIEYLTVDEHESRLRIKGLFGDHTATNAIVTVGGVSVPPIFWSNNLIICDIPTVGAGSIGDVVVSVQGNKSNAVPLTEWIIPLELVKEEMTLKLEAHLKLRIRGDLHLYRTKPGELPKKDRPDELGLWVDPDNLGLPFAIGSTGSFVVGGQRHASCQIEECQVSQTESALSRNGVLPYKLATPGLGFGAYYKWSIDMKTLHVSLYVTVPDVGYEFRSNVACPGQTPVIGDQSINGQMQIQTKIDLPVLQFHVDENYNIGKGGYAKSEEFKWGLCQKIEKIAMTVDWPNVMPALQPTRDTPARIAGN